MVLHRYVGKPGSTDLDAAFAVLGVVVGWNGMEWKVRLRQTKDVKRQTTAEATVFTPCPCHRLSLLRLLLLLLLPLAGIFQKFASLAYTGIKGFLKTEIFFSN